MSDDDESNDLADLFGVLSACGVFVHAMLAIVFHVPSDDDPGMPLEAAFVDAGFLVWGTVGAIVCAVVFGLVVHAVTTYLTSGQFHEDLAGWRDAD